MMTPDDVPDAPRRPTVPPPQVRRGCLTDAAGAVLALAVLLLAYPAIRLAWIWLMQTGDRIAAGG